MTPECIPYYEPGHQITAHAEAAVTGKRFVKISEPKQGPASGALSTTSEGQNVIVSHCPAKERATGVAAHDAAKDAKVGVLATPGFVVPVTADGAVSAGEDVMVGTAGKAAKVAGGGASATATSGVVADNNALTYTANDSGPDGNDLSIALIDPGVKEKALSVDVDGTAIIVNLATDAENKISSTATEVIAAILEHDTASQLITAANTGASSGAGKVVAKAKTSLTGGADTGVVVGQALDDAADGADCMVKLV